MIAMRIPALLLCLMLFLPSISHGQDSAARPELNAGANPQQSNIDYGQLQRKVVLGQATLAEVRQALTDDNIAALANTVHGLYSMRWHRGVYNLLENMWALKKDNFPELQWEQFGKAPVRLALASTLIRTHPFDNQEYVEYLREHKYDEHEFHRAQVLVGLGFKGAEEDIDYIVEMASGDNPYVVQSAITALGLVDRPESKKALLSLREEFLNDPRNKVIENVLRKSYNWPKKATQSQ